MKRTSMIGIVPALIALVALAGTGCGKDSNPTQPAPAADVTIEIVANSGNSSYSPSPTTVTVGQTVVWHNAHSMTHTATANGGTFNTGNIAPGGTSQPITMNAQGTFAYHCGLHPSMVGTLTVNP
jgi:plastocyanin